MSLASGHGGGGVMGRKGTDTVRQQLGLVGTDIGGTCTNEAAFRQDGKPWAPVGTRARNLAWWVSFFAEGHVIPGLVPEAVWHSAQSLPAPLTRRLSKRASLAAIGANGMGGPLAGLNINHPVIYALAAGTPSASEADRPQRFPDTDYLGRAGGYYACRFLSVLTWPWKVHHERTTRVRHVLALQSFLAYRLTGELAEEWSAAGGSETWSHAYVPRDAWAEDGVGMVRDRLSPVIASGTAGTRVQASGTGRAECLRPPIEATGGNDYASEAEALGFTSFDQELEGSGAYEIVARPRAYQIDGKPEDLDVTDDDHVIPAGSLLLLQAVDGRPSEWARNRLPGRTATAGAKAPVRGACANFPMKQWLKFLHWRAKASSCLSTRGQYPGTLLPSGRRWLSTTVFSSRRPRSDGLTYGSRRPLSTRCFRMPKWQAT